MKKLIALCLTATLILMALPLSAFGARDLSYEERLARDLKNLGLFQGVSDTDFALGRSPTRVEALVMLIRLLGNDDDAKKSSETHPFTDVPAWADSYVAYAYSEGLTKGTSHTTFGTGTANVQMFLTFVLRALGYSDANGEDFLWNNPYALAEKAGVLPKSVDRSNFLRGDVVLVSYAALMANLKDSTQSLAQKLIADGVFTYADYETYYDASALENGVQIAKELSAEEIYNRCSPAVFYLEIYDKNGEAISSGSGFFIEESGVAITNYHVIEDGYSAKVAIPGTEEVYEVSGVYDYNTEYDWAVIQVAGAGFPTLKVGSEATVVGGATVYAIGSPLGLQNTISNGIISNTNRIIENVPYIQTSAAISHGSSGGALINKYGEVIGITSAGFTEGENLGLALPVSVAMGYQKGGLVSIADVSGWNRGNAEIGVPQGEATQREKAFALLLAVIDTMENERINGNPTYTERENTENGYIEYSISKNEDLTIDVIIWEIYSDDTYYTSLTLEPYSDTMFVYYSYNMEEDGYYFTGYTDIYAPSYTPESGIRFTHVEGTADRETNESICHGNLMAGMDFVQGIFYSLYELGDFSIADLGFINY